MSNTEDIKFADNVEALSLTASEIKSLSEASSWLPFSFSSAADLWFGYVVPEGTEPKICPP